MFSYTPGEGVTEVNMFPHIGSVWNGCHRANPFQPYGGAQASHRGFHSTFLTARHGAFSDVMVHAVRTGQSGPHDIGNRMRGGIRVGIIVTTDGGSEQLSGGSLHNYSPHWPFSYTTLLRISAFVAEWDWDRSIVCDPTE
jgi:hypothetical protein